MRWQHFLIAGPVLLGISSGGRAQCDDVGRLELDGNIQQFSQVRALINRNNVVLCNDTKAITGLGTTRSECNIPGSNESGLAQAEVNITVSPLLVSLSGSASASQTGGLTSRCSVFAAIGVRCVGGSLRVVETAHSASVSALGTIPFDIAANEFIMHPGDAIPVAIEFSVTGEDASRDFDGATGPCFYTLTATPVQLTSQNFFWTGLVNNEYSNPFNWSPTQCAPPVHNGSRSDTAVFNLVAGSILPVFTSGATADIWRILSGRIDVTGSAEVFSTSATEPSLRVSNGGSLALFPVASLTSVNAAVGGGQGESGVAVGGADTKWTNSGTATFNGDPAAKLDVLLGGQVETGNLRVGTSLLNAGEIQVLGVGTNGTPSTLKVNAELTMGDAGGTGNMRIENGGRVESDDLELGGGGTISVDGRHQNGARSTLSVGRLSVERGAQIEVKDGAALRHSANAFIGTSDGTGRAMVNNSASDLPPFDPFAPQNGGASWVGDSAILVGSPASPSEFIITDGGFVQCADLFVGLEPGEVGRVEVSEDGSKLKVTGALSVGADGQGSLDIKGGGTVLSNTGVVGALSASGSGSVVIQGLASDSMWVVTGNLDVGIDGATGIIALEGFPLVAGFQLPFVGLATLQVFGTLTVGPKGFIVGTGLLAVPTAQRKVLNGGFISPGLSPGVIVIEGDYEQTEAGTLVIEIAGLAEGQFDILKITGNAKLAGTLLIKVIDGFIPGAGDAVRFLDIGGGVEGQFTNVQFEGLPEGLALAVDPATGTITVQAQNPSGAQPVCGACGAGVAAMFPLMLVCLLLTRRGKRCSSVL